MGGEWEKEKEKKSRQKSAYIFVSEMLEQLQFAIRPLSEHRRAEGFHNLLNSNILVGELVPSRAIWRGRGRSRKLAWMPTSKQAKRAKGKKRKGKEGEKTYQTRPNAPMPTGWRSEYLHELHQLQKYPPLLARRRWFPASRLP